MHSVYLIFFLAFLSSTLFFYYLNFLSFYSHATSITSVISGIPYSSCFFFPFLIWFNGIFSGLYKANVPLLPLPQLPSPMSFESTYKRSGPYISFTWDSLFVFHSILVLNSTVLLSVIYIYIRPTLPYWN